MKELNACLAEVQLTADVTPGACPIISCVRRLPATGGYFCRIVPFFTN